MKQARSHSRVRFVVPLAALALAVVGAVAWSPTTSAAPQVPTGVWFVNPNATAGTGTGTTWANAFLTLDAALAAVQPTEQVWVAQSTYTPLATPSQGFYVPPNVKLYGAFIGGELSVAGRQGSAAATILDGNLGGGQSSAHVLQIATAWPGTGSPGVLIDGFTIQNGNATQATWTGGGGILCQNTDLTLVGCHVVDNDAEHGGGLCFEDGNGDQVHNTLLIKQCEFRNNFATNRGGGLFGDWVVGTIVNTEFLTNEATLQGGGVCLQKTGPPNTLDRFDFANTTFWGNRVFDGSAGHFGGGVCLLPVTPFATNAGFVNCTFSDNYANNCADGQALFAPYPAIVEVYNSILAFNNNSLGCTNQPIGGGGLLTVEYCDTWWGSTSTAWPTGSGNIAVNPLFRRHSGGFLTLVGMPTGQPGSSLCIDAANHALLPADTLDVDNDGNIVETLPVDLQIGARFVPRWEPDTGAPPGASWLDLGAYEHSP